MHSVFGDLLDDFLTVYLDDLLVYSASESEHLAHLRIVFARLREHKLRVKISKCEFGKQQVEYLGHIVGHGQVRMDPSKVQAIVDWPALTCVKHVQ